MKRFIQDTVWWLRKVPVTGLIILVTLATGIYTKALWIPADSSGLTDRIGFGLAAFRDGNLWSLLVGAMVTPEPWMYVGVLIPLAIGAGYLEYKHGVARMLLAVLVTHIIAVCVVALLLSILAPLGVRWAVDLATVRDVGLSNAAFGAVGAATAALSLVWRRRLRTGLLLFLAAFLLFSGMIWDLTHFVALVTGFAIGPWVVGRRYSRFGFRFQKQEVRSLVASLVIFFAVTRLVSRLYPGNGGLLAFDAADKTHAATMLLTVGLSVFLLLIAYGLYAGRRIAWWPALLATIILLFANLTFDVTATSLFDIVMCSLMIGLLVWFRSVFDVLPDKQVQGTIYKRLLLLAVGLLVGNALAVYAIRTSYSPRPSFVEAVGESMYQIIGVSTRKFSPITDLATAYTDSISYIWAAAVIIGGASLLFTTYRERNGRGLYDEYDSLLHQSGCSTIGWMARWPGMSYWVNPSRTAGFAYRLENNIAIVLSDPVGSKTAVASALDSFEALCQRRGWHPVYYAVSDEFRRLVVAQRQHKSVVVGEDTVIQLADLAFNGKAWQSVRTSLNKAAHNGIRMRVITYSEAPLGLRDQLHTIADGWLKDKSLPEMGFTLGTLAEAADAEVRMHVAIDEEGTVHGMTSWYPVYQKGTIVGWTVDIMQRRLSATTMPGVMEFLIAESAMTFKQEEYDFISLSATPLSRSAKASNALESLLDIVAQRLEPYYGFKSLYDFKKKFAPRHDPLYLCYHDEILLPAIAVAIGKAYMPENVISDLLRSTLKRN